MQKYEYGSEDNKSWLKELREDLFRFGKKFPSPGGGSYYLGDDGTPWKDRPRETWITSRMAHVYSLAAMLGMEGADALADAALKGLMKTAYAEAASIEALADPASRNPEIESAFNADRVTIPTGELRDEQNGGWFAGISADGQILPTKQCYAHAFVILAATSGLLAGRKGAKELLEEALEIYDRYFWNEEEGLSCDTWNTEFTELDSYRGINANMHTVEAFLAAADTLKEEKYRIRAGRIIDHVIGWAGENAYRIPEHFSEDWIPQPELNADRPDDPFKPYGATPGHGIEWARLIIQWALSSVHTGALADAAPYTEVAEKLYRRAITDGWNTDGAPGICYTTDWNGNPVVHDRMHWTLAEAINTSAILYRLTGEEEYYKDYYAFMQYLDEYVLDHVNGSWFHQLNEKNELLDTVWPGKSDLYHAVQAMMIPYADPAVSIARWVREDVFFA